jgi:outer membrane murein-binding lipoprotein Lpp
MASLHAKMDMLMSKMEELSVMQAKVMHLESTVSSLNEKVSNMEAEIRTLKDQANYRDQLPKANSVRLFGLCSYEEDSDDSNKGLIKKIYDTIVKPVLNTAKANRQLESVPSLTNTISDVIRLKPGGTTPVVGMMAQSPAPLIVKFASNQLKVAFLRNKRNGMPAPSEQDKAAGSKYYSATEDLTGPTYKMMRAMSASDLVDKVWSIRRQAPAHRSW